MTPRDLLRRCDDILGAIEIEMLRDHECHQICDTVRVAIDDVALRVGSLTGLPVDRVLPNRTYALAHSFVMDTLIKALLNHMHPEIPRRPRKRHAAGQRPTGNPAGQRQESSRVRWLAVSWEARARDARQNPTASGVRAMQEAWDAYYSALERATVQFGYQEIETAA